MEGKRKEGRYKGGEKEGKRPVLWIQIRIQFQSDPKLFASYDLDLNPDFNLDPSQVLFLTNKYKAVKMYRIYKN